MKLYVGLIAGLIALACIEAGRPPDGPMLLASTVSASLIFLVIVPFRVAFRKPRRKAEASPLDRVVMTWNGVDNLTVRDLLSGGLAVFGRPGSGKSSTIGRLLMRAILMLGSSGLLILASKPEDRADVERLVAQCGRSADLVIVEPHGARKCNFIESIGTDSRDATKLIMTLSESLKSGDTGSGEKEAFWASNQERAIHGSAELCRQAYGRISVPDIHKFLMDAPTSAEQIRDEKWRGGFFYETLRLAAGREKGRIEGYDYELYKEQFLSEWATMDPKTRSGILAGINGLTHVLLSGIVRDMVSTETTVSPADLGEGRIIFVDMPVMKYGESARVVLGGWKFIAQRWVLRRKAAPGDRIVGIWADEAQNVINSFDFFFLSECRSHLGFLTYLTQSIHSYRSALRGQTGEHLVEGLLSCFLHKVFFVCGDHLTAKYASDLLGHRLEALPGASDDGGGNAAEELFGARPVRASFSQSYQPILQPNAFLRGRTGGPCKVADAYVITTGTPFSTGENFIKCAFSQE